jgi:GMP synthase-like glutamine amidotransferase
MRLAGRLDAQSLSGTGEPCRNRECLVGPQQMKPVAIFHHTRVGDPGTVLDILEELRIPFKVIRIVDGKPVPPDPSAFSGLVLMGGYMGVNDPYPWIAQEISLVQQADEMGLPVAGHCLGSQMVAVAFGGRVHRNPVKEMGWGRIVACDVPESEEWLGVKPGEGLTTFQWHADTFDPPPGSVCLATSEFCRNQAFVHRGRHLAIQSHFEMTPELVLAEIEKNGAQLVAEYVAGNPAVASVEETLASLTDRTRDMRVTLARCYRRWVQGLKET